MAKASEAADPYSRLKGSNLSTLAILITLIYSFQYLAQIVQAQLDEDDNFLFDIDDMVVGEDFVDLEVSEYDSDFRSWIDENFDPTKSDPKYAITCLGRPEIPLPRFQSWDPNTLTMQELCARLEYGGKAPGQHLGGQCAHKSHTPGKIRSIRFDVYAESQTALELANERIYLHCRSRCYCTTDALQLDVQPQGYDPRILEGQDISIIQYPSGKLEEVAARPLRAYQIQIDRLNDWDEPPIAHHKRLPPEVPFTRIDVAHVPLFLLEPNEWHARRIELEDGRGIFQAKDRLFHQDKYAFLDPENYLECDGPLPSFPLPAPYIIANFTSLLHMCAVQLAGGNPGANAGGYCHRNNPGPESLETFPIKSLWFADEMTPRIEWTWNNFLASASIRFHCRKFCGCSRSPKSKELSTIDPAYQCIWKFVSRGLMFQHHDGSIEWKSTGGSNRDASSSSSGGSSSSQYTLSILPPQTNGPVSGTCGPDGKQFCSTPWPVDILGPIPLAPPQSRQGRAHHRPAFGIFDLPLLSKTESPPFCSARCYANEDCSTLASSSCPYAPRCAVDPSSMTETVIGGLSTVIKSYLVSRCVLRFQSAKLGGRSVVKSGSTGADEYRWPCACNASYVSNACCEAEDGIVWEEKVYRLGDLRV